jgi:serine/threonine protein kinase
MNTDTVPATEFDARAGIWNDRRPEGPMLIGNVGDYALVKELGRGDMAIVYQARSLSRNRLLALKMF